MKKIFLLLTLWASVALSIEDEAEEGFGLRRGRQMFAQRQNYINREQVRLPICNVDGTVGACMHQSECSNERGKFAGYCGDADGVCCVVDKTCDQSTKSHHTYFRNPSFPRNDSQERPCPFTVEIGRGVCGVRLDLDKFELAKFEDGVCIRDTLTILGSKLGPTTPICGNMTSWSTSFAVEANSKVQLAMVLQGDPEYTFSISVTQLACDDIAVFRSPTYAGIRNDDAPFYKPTTTERPKPVILLPRPSTTEATTEEDTQETTEEASTTPAPGESNETTEDSSGASDGDSAGDAAGGAGGDADAGGEDTGDAAGGEGAGDAAKGDGKDKQPDVNEREDRPTTLKPGVISKPVIREVQISAKNTEDDGVYLDTIDSTPSISGFRRAFEQKVNDKCWQLEAPSAASFRIIGGSYTGINEYPWQVALVYGKKFFCGGSLISDRHILTAAHCVFGSFSKGLGGLRISIADHDLTTKNETENIVAKVKHIFWHLHYNPHTTTNDIALMELEEPVNFRYGVSAVKLPSDLDDMYEEQNATVTGWGRYSSRRKVTSPVLKEFTGPLMKSEDCLAAWKVFPGISALYPHHVCLDVMMGTPCHGDSGGPLVACTGHQCTQIGVVSFGFPLCTNVGLPAVFTRVTHYKGWIDMNLTPLDVIHDG